MKTISKFFAAALTVLFLCDGASLAQAREYVVKRIDHSKGQPTFMYVPVDKATGYQDGQTIAFFGRGRSALVPAPVDDEYIEVERVPVERSRRVISRTVTVEPW